MILQIASVLDANELAAIRDALADDTLWADGRDTAKGRALAAKNNQQARADATAVKGIVAKIRTAMLAHPTIEAAARPSAFARVMLNRYGPGMGYGPHVDAPYIEGLRTDISFTLFLAAPADYDGGELVIDTAGAEDAIKLPAGALVLYPANSVHRVAEITRGTRLAAVGWIKSRVRRAEHRAILFDLETAIADLAALDAPSALRDRLANLRNNLLRAFGE